MQPETWEVRRVVRWHAPHPPKNTRYSPHVRREEFKAIPSAEYMTIPSVNAISSAIYIGDQSDTNSSTYKSERNPSHATRGFARQKTAFCKQNFYFLPTEMPTR